MDSNLLNLGAGSNGSGSQPATQNPQNIGTPNLLPAGTSSLQGGARNSGLNSSGQGSIPLGNFQLGKDFDSGPPSSSTKTNRWPLLGASVFVLIVIVVIVAFMSQQTAYIRRQAR